MNVLATASAGLIGALNRFDRSAERTALASNFDSDVDPTHEVVDQIGAKHAVEANIAVLRTADEMTRRLLDIKA